MSISSNMYSPKTDARIEVFRHLQHKILRKSSQESVEIIVGGGKGWKLLLNGRDLQADRLHCTRNRHSIVMNTATSLGSTSGYRRHHLFHAGMLLSFLGPGSSQMDRKTVEACAVVRGVRVTSFLGNTDAKGKTDHPGSPVKGANPTSVMVWRCVRAHSMGDLHIVSLITSLKSYFNEQLFGQLCYEVNDMYESIYWDFRESYAAFKATSFPRTSRITSAFQSFHYFNSVQIHGACVLD